MSGKILQVGMPRTGNMTLCQCLRILGYQAQHYLQRIEDIAHADAWTEARFAPAQLDCLYPDSQYILTVRDVPSWLQSVRNYLPRRQPNWNPFWFQDPRRWPELYYQRVNEVLLYFGASPRLLILSLCNGQDGWEPLCRFLDKPVPDVPFPHLNRSAE